MSHRLNSAISQSKLLHHHIFCYPIWFLIPYLLIIIPFAIGLWAVFPEDFHTIHKVASIFFYITTILILSTLKCLVKHEGSLNLDHHTIYNVMITASPPLVYNFYFTKHRGAASLIHIIMAQKTGPWMLLHLLSPGAPWHVSKTSRATLDMQLLVHFSACALKTPTTHHVMMHHISIVLTGL